MAPSRCPRPSIWGPLPARQRRPVIPATRRAFHTRAAERPFVPAVGHTETPKYETACARGGREGTRQARNWVPVQRLPARHCQFDLAMPSTQVIDPPCRRQPFRSPSHRRMPSPSISVAIPHKDAVAGLVTRLGPVESHRGPRNLIRCRVAARSREVPRTLTTAFNPPMRLLRVV